MNILFRQSKQEKNLATSRFSELSICDCYLKQSTRSEDVSASTKKRHHHTHFEIHIIREGAQIYEIEGVAVTVHAGEFLMIAPKVPHRVLTSEKGTRKYALTFSAATEFALPYLCGKTPKEVAECIRAVCYERQSQKPFCESVMLFRIFECVLHFLRLATVLPEEAASFTPSNDARVALAKAYVKDNVQAPLTVADLAAYTHLSVKHLERLFIREDGVGVASYIRARRTEEIERLLSCPGISLRQISELMGFSSEYYFSVFFKRQTGVSPGVYRKMITHS